jgi:CheY-like chemotaxis protein
MVVRRDDCMKLLVVEQNETVSKIFKKIFDEKQYEADFAKNDFECLERFSQNYDYIVVENSQTNPSLLLEQKILKIKPSQKFFSLSRYINYQGPTALKETQDLIEKPFAMLTMVAKLEQERTNLGY